MKVTAENYESLKGVLGWMFGYTGMLAPNLPPEAHPIAVLEKFERQSVATARRSLQMGLSDMIEMTDRWGADELMAADLALTAANLPKWSIVQIDFSKKIERIMAKSKCANETEFYTLRNAVESLHDEERGKAWAILDAYELRDGR